MASFAQIRDVMSSMPERHVTLKADAFASDWPGTHTDVCMGLRKIADNDLQTARAEAAKYAIEMHEDREGQIESFNDCLMRWLIVRGTCDANDIKLNEPLFGGFEENVRLALTAESIRYVYDHIERFHIECSPVVSEASDEEIIDFVDLLIRTEAIKGLTVGAQKRLRKLIGFLHTELKEVLALLPDEGLSSQPDTNEIEPRETDE